MTNNNQIEIRQANETMVGMGQLKSLIRGMEKTIQQLRVEGDFREGFMRLVKLVKSPFAQTLISAIKVDTKIIDTIVDGLLYDQQVADIVKTIANIFDCFSVDRFIGVESEQQLEELAVKLNKKKLFMAAVHFGNEGQGGGAKGQDYSYELRMDIDNTPMTLENKNRLWFPGPDGNFELHMRYHRGFIQIQHMIDQAITKTVVDDENKRLEELWRSTTTEAPSTTEASAAEEEDEDETTVASDSEIETTTAEQLKVEEGLPSIPDAITTQPPRGNGSTSPDVTVTKSSVSRPDTPDDIVFRDERPLASADANETDSSIQIRRRKRSPQHSFLDFFSSSDSKTESQFTDGLKLPDVRVHTKQFPYPKYRKDNFITGLYLAQAVQLAFFFALIIQVSSCVRQRIWMRESGNSMVRNTIPNPNLSIELFIPINYQLMKIMGLKNSSENISWIVSTLIDLSIALLLCEIILYAGGILQSTNPLLLYCFLIVFAACVIAFWYFIRQSFSRLDINLTFSLFSAT